MARKGDVAMDLVRDQDDIVIRVPKAEADQAALNKLLDFLEFESIRRRSKLTQDAAETLTSEIKQGAWQQVKHLFED